MVDGLTGVGGSLVLQPVALAVRGDSVTATIHHHLEEEAGALACLLNSDHATWAPVLVCLP